ncbi:hypothetical protein [Hyphomicrobium sp.]|uniref:hypothetical protein n=1 Tax=Hyphomicrobium sp. TaxID=82 RepID=UPI002FE37C02
MLLVLSAAGHAQLVGSDTAPGDPCAGVAQGATRMNADPDQDGKEVVLVCDGTTWNAVEDVGIEAVTGAPAPISPGCTQRTATGATTTVSVSCNAGEIMTGGGCSHSATPVHHDSGPSAAATWRCEWGTAVATGTAHAICCTF